MAADGLVDNMLVEMAAILNNKRPPSERKRELQRALFLEGFIRFAEIFAQSELGDMEVNIAKIATYVYSPEFAYQESFEIRGINDVYRAIENDILNGMPIWRFFKCSKWTAEMLDRQFTFDAEEEKRRIEEKYICKRCRSLKEEYHDLGYLCKCTNRKREDKVGGSGFHNYKRIRSCKFFEEKIKS
jgi:hypothetical protein